LRLASSRASTCFTVASTIGLLRPSCAPKSWTEKAYPNLIYYNRLPKGGHFAAWEQPELFVQEMRSAFKSLRPKALAAVAAVK